MSKKLYVARNSRTASRKLGDDMLVMSGQDSTLFTLNPTATILWQGLAFIEGNMRGPSTADCEKSFARTGIPSANLLAKKEKVSPPRLVQIQLVPAITGSRLSGFAALQGL